MFQLKVSFCITFARLSSSLTQNQVGRRLRQTGRLGGPMLDELLAGLKAGGLSVVCRPVITGVSQERKKELVTLLVTNKLLVVIQLLIITINYK